jgi:succinyl-CoA synthetase beta subunit
LEGKTHS